VFRVAWLLGVARPFGGVLGCRLHGRDTGRLGHCVRGYLLATSGRPVQGALAALAALGGLGIDDPASGTDHPFEVIENVMRSPRVLGR